MRKLFLFFISACFCFAIGGLDNAYAKPRSSNPPGPKGGPGAGNKAVVDTKWEKRADANKDGVVGNAEKRRWDNRPQGNPPGPKGGPGAGKKPAN